MPSGAELGSGARAALAGSESLSGGLVVAANQAAATAGAHMLEAGGSAVDAAVSAALALCVVDPANCGIGGYGGFLVVQPVPGGPVHQVGFNTGVPREFVVESLAAAPRSGGFVTGGRSVSVPAVVPGLAAAHAEFGRLPFRALVEPALRLAREGMRVTSDLVRSLRREDRDGAIAAALFGSRKQVQVGDIVRQSRLADSLEHLATHGPAALREGPLVDAICAAVQHDGGALTADDFARMRPDVSRATSLEWAGVTVHAPDRQGSGAGVLLDALAGLNPADAQAGGRVSAPVEALRSAWDRRRESVRPLVTWPGDTTHLCASDADGGLVSVTFTHGPVWFGSGVVAGDTGILLNGGVNVFGRCSGDDDIRAVANVTPILVEGPGSRRHALGSPGGHKIPAIMLSAVVDLAVHGSTLTDSFGRARVTVTPSGEIEAEPGADLPSPPSRTLQPADFYGPATGLTIDGEAVPAVDPRFEAAVAAPRPHLRPEGPRP